MLGPGTQPTDSAGNPIAVETTAATFIDMPDELENVTGTENLVLSLLGGIIQNDAGDLVYDPAAVGRGAVALRPGDTNTYPAFFDARDEDTSMHIAGENDALHAGVSTGDLGKQWGKWVEEYGTAQDSMIPEFVDRFSDPMPILYMRANPSTPRVGSAGYAMAARSSVNGRAVFNLDQIAGYVTPGISGLSGGPDYYVGSRDPVNDMHADLGGYHGLQVGLDGDQENGFDARDGTYTYSSQTIPLRDGPYDAVPYLQNPAQPDVPVRSDSFVLISAGPDRVYGTADDITNFGNVGG
jgi:hypothetical protein